MMIGAFPFATYKDVTTQIEPGTKLFVFSDGCYEVVNGENKMMTVDDFSKLLSSAASYAKALDHIVFGVRAWQEENQDFEDDFSLVAFEL